MDGYYVGIRRTVVANYTTVECLRSMCDSYYDPRLCDVGGTRTVFNLKGLSLIEDMASLCLKHYNQKNDKNFILQQVVKLNVLPPENYCMTFEARAVESDECRYFRGVVDAMPQIDEVLLCEIKDDGGVTIPPEHDESYDPMSSENYWHSGSTDDDDDLSTVDSAEVDRGSDAGHGGGLAVRSVDVNCGSDVGSIGVSSAP